MPIKNFIEFATDSIHPDVFNEYKTTQYTEGDFTGADESTLDFTKLGWLMSVREDMKRKNTWTAAVDTLIIDLFDEPHQDAGGLSIPNYKTLSKGNYNLLQQLVFDNRNNDSFNLTYPYIDEFNDKVEDMLYAKFDSNQMSAAEMIIDFGLHNAVSKLSLDKLGTESNESLSSKRFSIYMYAYQKASSESVSIPDGTGKAAKTLNVIQAILDNDATEGLVDRYDAFYFQNPTTQSSAAYPKNELARMFSFLSHDLLETYSVKIVQNLLGNKSSTINGNPIYATALKIATAGSSGLSSSQVIFDKDAYSSRVDEFVQDKGYSPLYFYINRYRTECRKSILEELSKAFSPLAVSVDEGFTPLALLSSHLTVGSDGAWENADIADFIKNSTLEFSTVTNSFEVFAALGSVRDFTGGKTNNMFGTFNNFLVTINTQHKSWWATASSTEGSTSTIDDFEPMFTVLAEAVFAGNALSYANYKIWMFENGKEVS